MTIQVNINLDMHPTCVDLVFPEGVPKGGSVQLNLLRLSSRFAYVNERECVPVVRRRTSVLDQRYLEENITVHAFHEDDGHPLCFLKAAAAGARDAEIQYGEGTAAAVTDNDNTTLSPPAVHETVDDTEADVVEAGNDDVVAEEDFVARETTVCGKAEVAPRSRLPQSFTYVCGVCLFQSKHKEEALEHVKRHDSVPDPARASEINRPPSKGAAVRDNIVIPKVLRPKKKVAVFKCTECSKQFPADGLLRIHVRIYHGGPLQCKHCSSKFRSEQELDKHMQSDHLDRAPYLCSYCASAFFSADMLAAHEVKCPVARQQRQTVACQLCKFTTSEASSLCQHIQEAHTEKVIYTCEPCGHLSLDFSVHQEHVKSHGPDGKAPSRSPAPTSRGGESVQCPLCKKDFKNSRTLKEHIKRHPRSVRHVCELCGEGITTNVALIKHLNRHNKEAARKYQCLFCSKCFQTTFSVSRHMKNIHLFDHEHGCELCPHKFATVKEKADHMAKAHVVAMPKGKRVHKCTDCNFETESLGRFERHRASHTGVYPYECSECPRRFAAKEELSRHVHIIHPKGQQNCPQCPRLFQDQLEFDTHLQLHQDGQSHPCEECGHHFENAQALLEHRNKRHDLNLPYECRLCHQRFCNIGQRVTHVRKYHPRVLLKSHVCDICGSAFRYQSGLAVHKLDKHTGRTEGRLFECEYCGKVFGRSNVLAMHLRLHTGERPYLCQHCGLTFRNPTNLKYHTVNMHTKNYAVSCPICSRGFVVRRKLAKHLMQVHKVTGMVNTSSRKGRAKPVYIEHTTVPVVSAETGDDMVLNVMQIVDTADQGVTATELSHAVTELNSDVTTTEDTVSAVTEESVVDNVVEEAVEMVDISGVEFVSGATVECYTVS
ncbi:uncharacterized protein LOC142572805 [Dermacentor variabilis]|uniref:uncharacterized protein LOC142572805 n=1 Tax=Dermacentor variabilis TaxID=34621 RepID=UPI003F5AF462